ncbi:MAG: efflux RND transporter periplasmic adaptor subunit [Burkholderiaceae bacterium]|nr:efflux RND transporter periplasmic adaptor subunit [Ideonella sp.]MCC7287184.1 efflux RND transporter periplasmic adaptor subunit [Burkholderiaceae bacterium]
MKYSTTTLLLAGPVAILVAACTPATPTAEPVRAVRTLTLVNSAIGSAQEYAAEIRARTESRLGFRVGGKLLSRPVNLGDAVRAGQALARLDPADLQLGQQSAQAALGAAKANYLFSEAEFKRFKELRDQGFISGLELDRRAAALTAARAQFEQAQTQANVQGNQARYATLSADAAGVITGVDVEPGAVVAAGAPVVRLAHDGPRDVVFNVPEDRVAEIRALLGKTGAMQARLWNNGRQPIAATVREVAAAADPVTRTFVVKADVGHAAVRLGQTASVKVETARGAEGIKVPLTAVFEAKGVPAVWVLDRGTMTVKAQPVRVAGADGNDVTLAQGVQAGQTIVVAGVHVLNPGQKVRLYAERVSTASNTGPAR